ADLHTKRLFVVIFSADLFERVRQLLGRFFQMISNGRFIHLICLTLQMSHAHPERGCTFESNHGVEEGRTVSVGSGGWLGSFIDVPLSPCRSSCRVPGCLLQSW